MMTSPIFFIYSWILSVLRVIFTVLFDDNNDKYVQKSVYSEDEWFFEEIYEKFLETYDSGEQDQNANINMDKEFYDNGLYKKTISVSDNDFEKKWKRNILYVNTPRGNIVMMYDAYKKGFAYYCDTQSVSSIVLNALAMKYVMVFRCRDLFIDNHLTPEERDSPLIKLQLEEENAEKEKKKQNNTNSIDPNLLKNAPFAKLKKYNTAPSSSTQTNNNNATEKETEKEKEKNEPHITNKFIYLGKIVNFSFMPKKIKSNRNHIAKSVVFQGSKMESMFEEEHNLQKEVMSYKDYKRAYNVFKNKID